MSLVYGSAAVPAPSGTNTVLQWSGSAFSWATPAIDSSGNISPASLTWGVAASSPTLLQATATSDVAPQNLTIQPQGAFASATGTNRTGGSVNVALAAPTNGGTVEAALNVNVGGTNVAALQRIASTASSGQLTLGSGSGHSIQGITGGSAKLAFIASSTNICAMTSAGLGGAGSGIPLLWQQQTITGMVTTGTQTLTGAQQQARLLIAPTTTLTGNLTIDFGAVIGEWLLDLSAVTVGANTVTLKNGAGTKVVTTLLSGTSTLLHVVCYTAATVNAL